MRSNLIVMAAPVLNDDPGLRAVAEPFHGQTFISELPIEAFVGAVLPRLAWFDQDRFIHGVIPRVGVRLQDAAVIFQLRLWVGALAAGGADLDGQCLIRPNGPFASTGPSAACRGRSGLAAVA